MNKETTENWTEQDVIERWQQLCKLPPLVERYVTGKTKCSAENEVAQSIIEIWRDRLMDISWYMRMLNEYLARKANTEDNCKGRFWEGRFKSQALLDDAAVLTCMSYVDLNPIRAAMTDSLETSDFTSIQQRISEWKDASQTDKNKNSGTKLIQTNSKLPLVSLIKSSCDTHIHSLNYLEQDYLELVDWAGRSIIAGKRGYIPEDVPPILVRLGLDAENFVQHMQGKRPHLSITQALGRLEKLRAYANQLGVKFIKGFKQTQVIYQ